MSQNDNHVDRVRKIRVLEDKLKCGNHIAREALKSCDWNEEKALEKLNNELGKV